MTKIKFQFVTILSIFFSLLLFHTSTFADEPIGASLFTADGWTGLIRIYDPLETSAHHFSVPAANLNLSIAAGDINGDHFNDEIVTVDGMTGIVRVYTDEGELLSSFQVPVANQNLTIAVGDVNTDHVEEVIIADGMTGSIRIYDIDGNVLGGFDGLAANQNLDVAVGDVNGDGVDEIMTADGMTGSIRIYDIDGNVLGGFGGSAANQNLSMASGDVDADGTDDIVIADGWTGQVKIYRLDGSILESFSGPAANLNLDVAVGDFDADGADEIIRSDGMTGAIKVYKADGELVDSWNVPAANLNLSVAVGSRIDRDGDGLYDRAERFGIDVDADGTIDVDLPAMGADPLRKDLFVEVDCLVDDANGNGVLTDPVDHSHCPLQAAMQDVVQAFANAPVVNLDGTTGIQLHVDTGTLYGAGVIPVNGTANAAGNFVIGTFGDYGEGGDHIAEAGNQVVDWDGAAGRPGTSFYTLKAANFNEERAPAFRYALFVHQTNSRRQTNDCTSGWAENFTANDFFVSLGGLNQLGNPCWAIDANGFSVGSQNQQAGTFMHELGHTLNLAHGGDDGIHNKPNYLSVMNYRFQDCSVPSTPAAGVPGNCDFSRHDLPDLRETLPLGLDECAGIGGTLLALGPMDWDGDGILEGSSCPAPNTNNVQVDINGDDFCIGPGANGVLDTVPVGDDVIVGNEIRDGGNLTCDTWANTTFPAADVQLKGAGRRQPQPLRGFEDWHHLVYNFRHSPTYANGIAFPVPDEADFEMIQRAKQLQEKRLPPVMRYRSILESQKFKTISQTTSHHHADTKKDALRRESESPRRRRGVAAEPGQRHWIWQLLSRIREWERPNKSF